MSFFRAAVLSAVVLLAGCDVATQVSDMSRKIDLINAELKKDLGFEVQVSWNIHNGTLTQISVFLPADRVGDKSVEHLRDVTYPVVIKHFDTAPTVFQVVAVFEPGSK